MTAGIAALVLSMLSGCSTIQGDWNQRLQIDVIDSHERPVDGMVCQVGEGRSAQTVSTPAHDVRVHRSASPLSVSCQDASGTPGRNAIATVMSRRERMEEALLPFGSVGVFVDHLSGALYAYPARLQLRLGQRVVLEHGAQSQIARSEPLPLPVPEHVAAAPSPPRAVPKASAKAAVAAKLPAPKASAAAPPKVAFATPRTAPVNW